MNHIRREIADKSLKLGDKDIPIGKRVEYRNADIQKQEEKMKQLQQEAKEKRQQKVSQAKKNVEEKKNILKK